MMMGETYDAQGHAKDEDTDSESNISSSSRSKERLETITIG